MIIKLVLEVNKGVTLTDIQKDKLRAALAGEWVTVGTPGASKKLVMCLIDHRLVVDLITFATARGFNPVIKKANKQDGTRLGFQKVVDEETGEISYARDTEEVPANELLSNLSIDTYTAGEEPETFQGWA
jgi:hypothetical protein